MSNLVSRTLDPAADFEQNGLGMWVPRRPTKEERFDWPIAVDLFCGAGGFSCGFHRAGWHVIAASDNDPDSAITYLNNLGQQPVDIRFTSDKYRNVLEKKLDKMADANDGVPPIAGAGWISTLDKADRRHGCRLFWFGDIFELTGEDFLEPLGLEVGEVDCVFGGPPCQGFSKAGRREVDDPRNNPSSSSRAWSARSSRRRW